jgi:uncharacterized membrane protein YphA (DoxX/SURF4 family)
VTNQPEESHPLRDRVDEAISWFTQTDEPPEPTAAPVTEDRTPVVEESTPAVHDSTLVAPESVPVVEDRTEWPEPFSDAAPARAFQEDSPDTPVAANLPGNEAAPVDLATEPVLTEPVVAAPVTEPSVTEPVPAQVPAAEPVTQAAEVAPERVYEADEFSAHPVDVAPSQAEADTTDVAPERISEANDFVPAAADLPAAVVAEPVADAEPVAAEPFLSRVESSDVDEPTRIHPIEPPASWAEVHPEAKGLTADEVEAESAAQAATQRSLFRDEAPTVALPVGAVAAGAAAGAAVPAVEQTSVLDAQEAARLRREERAARDRQLGKVIAAPDDADEPLVTKFQPPSHYKGLPSFGFLLFRLVIAAVVGIRAWQHITHLTATREMWAATVVPSPGIIAWTQIGLEIAITVMLVIGLGTRIAGLALLVLGIAQLAFIQWGVVSPFQPGAADFIGVVDVLLAGAGILLATVGGGRIAFDGAIHTGRIRRKNDKLFS